MTPKLSPLFSLTDLERIAAAVKTAMDYKTTSKAG